MTNLKLWTLKNAHLKGKRLMILVLHLTKREGTRPVFMDGVQASISHGSHSESQDAHFQEVPFTLTFIFSDLKVAGL